MFRLSPMKYIFSVKEHSEDLTFICFSQLKNFFTNNSRRMSFTQINDQARRASLESNKPSSVAGIITPVHITHSITDSQIGHIKDELSSSERYLNPKINLSHRYLT